MSAAPSNIPGCPEHQDGRRTATCSACKKLYHRAYYLAHQEELKAATRRSYNPERALETHRKWVHRNPERRRAIVRKWMKAHPDSVRFGVAARRARIAMNCPNSKDPRVRAVYAIAAWLVRQGDGVEVDHIVPVKLGGQHVYHNLRILPTKQNRLKSSSAPSPTDMDDLRILCRSTAEE